MGNGLARLSYSLTPGCARFAMATKAPANGLDLSCS